MTTIARTAAPANALRMWSDNRYVYAEIPAKLGGLPHVMKFSHTEGGMSKALHLLQSRAEHAEPPLLCRPKCLNAKAAAVLRNMGVID